MKRNFCYFRPGCFSCWLTVCVFTSSYQVDISNPETIRRASSSMSVNVLKGDAIKNYALSENNIFLFGSSELSRISPFHPSVLAEKYQRNYRPFCWEHPDTIVKPIYDDAFCRRCYEKQESRLYYFSSVVR